MSQRYRNDIRAPGVVSQRPYKNRHTQAFMEGDRALDEPSDVLGSDRGETPPIGQEVGDILTVEECAAYLRMNRKTVLAAISKGQLPGVVRLGRVIRIHKGSVLDWVKTGQGQRPSKKRAP